jgi:predicted nucleic acid-binding protein
MSVDFLDTNVFIYLFDDVDTRKRGVAERLVSDALASGRAVVSYQVVQEALNVITRKLGASTDDARRFLDVVLDPLWQVGPSSELYGSALDVRGRYGFPYLDALIVASALAAGCTRLLSEDLQHGQRIGDLVVVDPFRATSAPGS